MYLSIMMDGDNPDSSSNRLCKGRVKLCEVPQFHKGMDAEVCQICMFLFLDMWKIIILYKEKRLIVINFYVIGYKSTSTWDGDKSHMTCLKKTPS